MSNSGTSNQGLGSGQSGLGSGVPNKSYTGSEKGNDTNASMSSSKKSNTDYDDMDDESNNDWKQDSPKK